MPVSPIFFLRSSASILRCSSSLVRSFQYFYSATERDLPSERKSRTSHSTHIAYVFLLLFLFRELLLQRLRVFFSRLGCGAEADLVQCLDLSFIKHCYKRERVVFEREGAAIVTAIPIDLGRTWSLQ